MHGKTVQFRHCPATVSGRSYPAFVTASGEPMWEDNAMTGAASQETGSADYLTLFSEGERIMAVLTFLFFLFASPPDNVKGTILDPTGASVAGARVEISAAALSQSATTDGSGTFSIEGVPSGTYSLRVTASGFSAYVTSVEIPSEGLKVVLSVAPRSEDVIVTTTQVETPLSMLGVSATVVDREQIAQQQGAPISQMLRNVPGLAVTT